MRQKRKENQFLSWRVQNQAVDATAIMANGLEKLQEQSLC